MERLSAGEEAERLQGCVLTEDQMEVIVSAPNMKVCVGTKASHQGPLKLSEVPHGDVPPL